MEDVARGPCANSSPSEELGEELAHDLVTAIQTFKPSYHSFFCIFAPHSPVLFITLSPQIDELLVFDPYFPIMFTVPLRKT